MLKYLEPSVNDMANSKKPLLKIINDIYCLESNDTLFSSFNAAVQKHYNYTYTITQKICSMIQKEGLSNSPFAKF